MKSPLPTRHLVEKPDLDQLKRQARELLDAFVAGQPDATTEVNRFYHDCPSGAVCAPPRPTGSRPQLRPAPPPRVGELGTARKSRPYGVALRGPPAHAGDGPRPDALRRRSACHDRRSLCAAARSGARCAPEARTLMRSDRFAATVWTGANFFVIAKPWHRGLGLPGRGRPGGRRASCSCLRDRRIRRPCIRDRACRGSAA